jgi:hypothetical protein
MPTVERTRGNRIRRGASCQALRLACNRRRDALAIESGLYRPVDHAGEVVVPLVTLKQIERYLTAPRHPRAECAWSHNNDGTAALNINVEKGDQLTL